MQKVERVELLYVGGLWMVRIASVCHLKAGRSDQLRENKTKQKTIREIYSFIHSPIQ